MATLNQREGLAARPPLIFCLFYFVSVLLPLIFGFLVWFLFISCKHLSNFCFSIFFFSKILLNEFSSVDPTSKTFQMWLLLKTLLNFLHIQKLFSKHKIQNAFPKLYQTYTQSLPLFFFFFLTHNIWWWVCARG